jgi:hypothetical protein
MSERKDVIIKVPTAKITGVALVPSVTAVSKDKNDNIKAKRHGNEEGNYSADYDGEIVKESAEITNPKSKSEADQKNIEKQVVRRLLPVFNRDNSANFLISNEETEPDHIVDVFIEDSNTKAKIAIQVTVSDEKAIAQLRSTKSLSRSGNAYQLFSDAIKTRIGAKTTTKYPEALRRKTVLALDGWHGVTKKILDSFKMQEKDFLEQAGYSQIWFVGIITEEVVRLY